MSNHVNRRFFVAGATTAGALALSGAPALAMTTGSATKLVDKVVADINAVIASGQSEAQMFKTFEKIFARYADVPTISRYALGVEARSASNAQLSKFSDAFQVYISRKYGRRFREFIGGRIEVDSAKAVKSFFEVKSVAYLKGQSPFEVTFLVSDRSGKDLFFNMFIEGINMLLTERTEIGAQLDRRKGNLDQLIKDLPSLG
jgi:phospholipid transport system substrate-binding protein